MLVRVEGAQALTNAVAFVALTGAFEREAAAQASSVTSSASPGPEVSEGGARDASDQPSSEDVQQTADESVTPALPAGQVARTDAAADDAQRLPRFQPSFDCRQARTGVETLICSSEQLGQLDADMANAYRQALNRADDKREFRSRQSTWRKTVRDICTDTACLADAYRRRISELTH